MLTPRFKLTQDENHVFINIHAPYTNIGDTEIDVEAENFLFVSSPYFLRLRLPGRIVDNDRSKGSYICDSGDFNLTFDKEVPGEHFENLDMITSLLAPKDIPDINPDLVELLEEDNITLDAENDEPEDMSNQFGYGFANKITTDFGNIGNEFPQIFDLRVPDKVSQEERHNLRLQHERHKFAPEHYIADLYDTELMEPYLNLVLFPDSETAESSFEFSDDEVGVLKELPNKHYLLTKTEYKQVLCGLIDILYGYCYDKRSTLNESTVESSWTINKLSSTLSWFCVFTETWEVLIACYRRALIFPIFRNFDLCKCVQKDVEKLLRRGKKYVIKCMIEIHQMFNTSNDARYILNQLYIKDYLVFLQKCKSEEIEELAKNIADIHISKSHLQMKLDELEQVAEKCKQHDIEVVQNKLAAQLASLSLLPGVPTGIDSDESSSDSDDSSSESSSSSDESEELDSDDEPPQRIQVF